MKLFVAQISIARFFSSIFEKVNIFDIYESIILIFSVRIFLCYLSTNFIRKKFISNNQKNLENNIYVGEVLQGMLKFKFNVRNHRNF